MNEELLAKLKISVNDFNDWRSLNPDKTIDLESANFEGILLNGVNFSNANLKKTIFSEVEMDQGNLENANLEKAKLISVKIKQANFRNANLAGANISLSDAAGAVFREANLNGANFLKADLTKADFQDAIVRNVSFREANLSETNFLNAKLKGTNFTTAILKDCMMDEEELDGKQMQQVKRKGCKLIAKPSKGKNIPLVLLIVLVASLFVLNAIYPGIYRDLRLASLTKKIHFTGLQLSTEQDAAFLSGNISNGTSNDIKSLTFEISKEALEPTAGKAGNLVSSLVSNTLMGEITDIPAKSEVSFKVKVIFFNSSLLKALLSGGKPIPITILKVKKR
jgi:uncharacterized protein YjbI with pentapeptide repeats